MSDEPLVSYAQNAEDVVLWRALGDIRDGIYVDVGGYDPDEDSITRIFYDRGWRGIDVEPVPELAARFRSRRPGNEVVEAAVTDQDLTEVVLHWFNATGLSTLNDAFADRHDEAGLDHRTITVPVVRLDDVLARSSLVSEVIHFLKVDVEGAEAEVLRSLDLTRWRPWVLVVEATEPNSTTPTHEAWEPRLLEAGYSFTLFDGLSRFYVSPEHPELVPRLSYPACVLDGYTTARQAQVERRLIELDSSLALETQARLTADEAAQRWRNSAATYWAEAVAKVQSSDAAAEQAQQKADRSARQVADMRETLQRVRNERNRLRGRIRDLHLRLTELQEQLQHPRGRGSSALGRARRSLNRAKDGDP